MPVYAILNSRPEQWGASPPPAEVVSPRPTDSARATSDGFALPSDSGKKVVSASRETNNRIRDALFAKLSESDWSLGS